MPVVGSLLRTSTNHDLMMYIETPGAPSRTMTSVGGNSAIFKQLPNLIKLSLLSSAKSLTFFKNPTSCCGSLVRAVDMNPYRSYLSRPSSPALQQDESTKVSLRVVRKSKEDYLSLRSSCFQPRIRATLPSFSASSIRP